MGRARRRLRVELDVGAPHDDAGVVGDVGLTQLVVEGREDPRRLEDGPGAPGLTEDGGGVPLGPGDLELPGAEAPAADHRRSRHRPLEGQGHVAPLPGVDEGGATDGVGLARGLLVPGEDHDHLTAVQLARPMEGPQRGQDDRVARLHVGGAAAVAQTALTPERLSLEDGVEVADEKQALPPGARSFGQQVPGAVDRGLVDPLRREAQRLELRRVEVGEAAHTGVVLGGAHDVHRPGEEVDGPLPVLVDETDDLLFGGGEPASPHRAGDGQQDQAQTTGTAHALLRSPQRVSILHQENPKRSRRASWT